jgi:pimeloyl-ACP methyl ester carboxylesterase
MRRVVYVAVSLVLLAMVAGCSSNPEQTVGRGMVEVDGAGLSYWCAGSGSPSVLIEQGLFGRARPRFGGEDDWYGWSEALLDISGFTHVCVYNRRGVTDSDPVETGAIRTIQDQTDDLVAFIDTLGIEGPLVLVGHSWGGLMIQQFAEQHLDMVAGLVLVDSTHPRTFEMFDMLDIVPPPPSPPEWIDIARSAELVGALGDLGDLPVVVLAAGLFPGATDSEEDQRGIQISETLQRDLTSLSADSEITILKDSNHQIMIDRPDAIVEAVRTIIERIG